MNNTELIEASAPIKTILFIEDSEDDYEATIRAFAKVNLCNPVHWCQTGQDALDYLHQRGNYTKSEIVLRPGLILLDLNLPGLDGRQTLQHIKEDPKLKDIPVIVLTTSNDSRDINDCYKMGANSYMQKPVSFDGLIEAVKRLKEYWFDIALLPHEPDHD